MKKRSVENQESSQRSCGRGSESIKQKKVRVDRLLVDLAYAPDIKTSQALIMAGSVEVDGCILRVPYEKISPSQSIKIKKREFVSRGGEKLQGALTDFNICVKDLVCADIGISTGGFTDCLLKNGAKRVYGFDVGYGVVDYSLRQDKRVILFERCNFREFDPSILSEKVDLIVMDLSFISVKKIIPNARELLKDKGKMLILVKPQFEAPRERVKRGGIVNDEETIDLVLKDISQFLISHDFKVIGIRPAKIKGKKGNQEYFILADLQRT